MAGSSHRCPARRSSTGAARSLRGRPPHDLRVATSCGVLTEYTAGHVGRADSRAVIGPMRSVAHDLEVEMGLAPGTYTMEALAQFLTEHQPWGAPERYRRFLVAFHQFDTVGLEHFGRTARPDEVRASAAGARLAAVAGP